MIRYRFLVFIILVTVVEVFPVCALIVESPKEGQVLVVGESFEWKIRPEQGEVCKSVNHGAPFNSETGMYEWTDKIPPNSGVSRKLGKQSFLVYGESIGDALCQSTTVPVTVVLPPATKVVSIGADFTGENETFLEIARKPSGELVVTEGPNSTDRLSIGALYSDGVGRFITNNLDITYKSLNEKVAIVFPPGQGKGSSGNVVKDSALVPATGPGRTDIIVQYGVFTDRVTVHVKECPYIEGETEKNGCPLR